MAAPEWLYEFSANCPVSRALEIIGEKWTLLVLRDAYYGVRRFQDFQQHLGVPRPVLSQRLTKLVDEGVLRRVPYQEPGSRPRHEYRLTQKGRDLFPIIVALMEWGDRYETGPEGPVTVLTHRDCGAQVHLEMRCDEGHVAGSVREVLGLPGPGAQRASAAG
jgi:DNA-binding HxlR family transcriptional regulator